MSYFSDRLKAPMTRLLEVAGGTYTYTRYGIAGVSVAGVLYESNDIPVYTEQAGGNTRFGTFRCLESALTPEIGAKITDGSDVWIVEKINQGAGGQHELTLRIDDVEYRSAGNAMGGLL